jgi:hypothetical protein
MLNIFAVLSIILIMAGGITKLVEANLNKEAKDKIKNKIEELWVFLDDSSPESIFKTPFLILHNLIETFLDSNVFSKKSFIRVSIVSITVLISSLGITGLITNTNFGFNKTPSDYFEQIIEIDSVSWEKDRSDISENQEVYEYLKKRHEFYKQINNEFGKTIYIVYFCLSLLVVNTIIDYVSFSITRIMLKEIISVNSTIIIVFILLINLMIATIFGGLIFSATLIITYPNFANLITILIPALFAKTPSWSTVGVLVGIFVAWKLTTSFWNKVFVITTLFPILTLILLTFFYVIISPINNTIYSMLKRSILYIIDYERGLFSYLTVVFITVGGIIGGICKLLN